jgi:hypothetical protein
MNSYMNYMYTNKYIKTSYICICKIILYVSNVGFTCVTTSNSQANQIKMTKPISTRRTNQSFNNDNETNENGDRIFECLYMHYYHKSAEFLPLL